MCREEYIGNAAESNQEMDRIPPSAGAEVLWGRKSMKPSWFVRILLILLLGTAFRSAGHAEKWVYYDAFSRFIKSKKVSNLFLEEDVALGLTEVFQNINIVVVNADNVVSYIPDTNWGINVLIIPPLDTVKGQLQVKFQVCHVEVFGGRPVYSIQKVYLYQYAYNQKKKKYVYNGMKVTDCRI